MYKDKPIKFVIEGNCIEAKLVYKSKTLKEVLLEVLRWNCKLRDQLTIQQIHSERGKVYREKYSDVINFLNKRGISKDYIENEQKEKPVIEYTTTITIPTDFIDSNKFGKFTIE